jgi:hypothetical protein
MVETHRGGVFISISYSGIEFKMYLTTTAATQATNNMMTNQVSGFGFFISKRRNLLTSFIFKIHFLLVSAVTDFPMPRVPGGEDPWGQANNHSRVS